MKEATHKAGSPADSEQALRLLVDSVKDHAIFMLDPAGRIVTWNSGAERIKGYTQAEIVGTHFSRFYQPEDVQAGNPERHLRMAAESGRVEYEGWRIRKDGSRFWANVVIAAIRGREGDLVGFAKVTRDYSERRAHEATIGTLNRELRLRLAQLTETNRELESFSYSVSHDLRAPLRSIAGFSQALLEDSGDKLSGAGREHLDRILAATRRMKGLIDGLLGLARLTKVELKIEDVDLAEFAWRSFAEVRAADPGRSIELRVADRLLARGDAALLRVVMDNLVGNAWKYTSQRSRALIEVGREERDGQVGYFVRDNGVGFDMAHAGRLFGAFQRLHRQDKFEGHGIGLATVRRIVRRHGGEIRAESAPDQGATFLFTLGSGARTE